MKSYFQLIFLAFLLITATEARSQQDSCLIYLKEANINYGGRYFDSAIEQLTKALDDCSLKKEDKIQAHKLLALCYLGIDELELASDRARRIIRLDPKYTPDKFRDEPDYVALFEKFVSTPVLRIGLYGGFNQVFTNVSKTYSVYHGENADEFSSYDDEIGFQLGMVTEYRILQKLWVNGAFQFRESNYSRTLSEIDDAEVKYRERMNYFELPVFAKYILLDSRLRPFLSAGGTFSLLNRSISSSERDDINDIVDRIDYRNTFMIGIHGGGGAYYRMNNFILFADLRYTVFTENVNKEGTRYADDVNLYKYYYLDDDFTMNNFQLNFGIIYDLVYRYKQLD